MRNVQHALSVGPVNAGERCRCNSLDVRDTRRASVSDLAHALDSLHRHAERQRSCHYGNYNKGQTLVRRSRHVHASRHVARGHWVTRVLGDSIGQVCSVTLVWSTHATGFALISALRTT